MLEWLRLQYTAEALWAAWGAVVLGYAVFFLFERIIPANRNPRMPELAADLRANFAFFLLNPLALFMGGSLSGIVAPYLGGPHFHIDLGRLGSGATARFFLAFVPLLVFDFFYYWFHRFQHAWAWLWQEHRLHHSEHFLNVTTNYRHHWLEEFFRAFLIVLPMNWLVSISPVNSAVAAFLMRQWSSFFHANIRIGFGAATVLVTGPQYHRIHHSIEEKHIGKNYAAFFPVWDLIFGTYWRPRREEWPETGLADTNGVWNFSEVLFSPFVGWWRRVAGSVK